MIILTVAAAISLTLGLVVPFLTEEESENGWIDGTAILAAVIIVAVVNVINSMAIAAFFLQNLCFSRLMIGTKIGNSAA
jgi:ABC-type methionine transport system permease subunit